MSNKLNILLVSQNWDIKWSEDFEFLLSNVDMSIDSIREDMFYAEKEIGGNHYGIDIGAYGREKILKLLFIKNQEWDTPLTVLKFLTFEDLLNKVIEILKEYDSYIHKR